MTDNTRGALLMMAAMAAFTINDAFMKLLAGQMPLFQAIFLRGLATTAVFLALAWRLGALRPATAGCSRCGPWPRSGPRAASSPRSSTCRSRTPPRSCNRCRWR